LICVITGGVRLGFGTWPALAIGKGSADRFDYPMARGPALMKRPLPRPANT